MILVFSQEEQAGEQGNHYGHKQSQDNDFHRNLQHDLINRVYREHSD